MNGIGDNLKRIRLLKNLSLKEAGVLLNMSPTAIQKYEKGEITPDSKKVIAFASAYNVNTLEILKVYKKSKMNFNSFRKRKRLSGKKLELLESIIEDEVSKYLEVINLNNINKSPVKLKKYNCNHKEDCEKIALEFRKYINISPLQPISDLINILENLGILIIQIKNVNNLFNDFDGLSEIVNGIPVIVLLDDLKDGARQRFTIAHELGHFLLNIEDNTLDEEKLCNSFASALLMPKDAVINEFGSNRKNINFYELIAFKKEYKVSIAAINYRLKDLNIISSYLYKNLSIIINKKIGKKDPDPIMPEKSYQFKKIIYKLEADEIISINKACELLGVTINEYRKENYNN
jgi:Zn-dependent peptidase ImmA (M78 family)